MSWTCVRWWARTTDASGISKHFELVCPVVLIHYYCHLLEMIRFVHATQIPQAESGKQ